LSRVMVRFKIIILIAITSSLVNRWCRARTLLHIRHAMIVSSLFVWCDILPYTQVSTKK